MAPKESLLVALTKGVSGGIKLRLGTAIHGLVTTAERAAVTAIVTF
jgi:hypothetical protein